MKVVYVEDTVIPAAREWAEQLAQTMERDFVAVPADAYNADEEADIVFFATACNARRVQRFLDIARPFRMPYIFLTPVMFRNPSNSSPETGEVTRSDGGVDFPLRTILAPVTMLEEEVHKAELLSHLARYTHASITLLTAKDYGSRARTNTNKILTFLHAREEALGMTFTIQEQTAQSNSMSLYKELMGFDASLLVQTASRDYGLDDILFGPVERKIILHAHAPVALINPRADLFSLCD